ncbi:hypothetical protein BDE27_1208 [Xenorhabdus ehlersii]|uniref:Uncharacterized protein n=1 Tax=Xenorhabdus ehlersii TaxID=290111 RepID=A0A2D0IUV6_9GAMM|nr:hypothetical protein Xehl_01294 [Xenorhabdus ehlersii]RKE93464.1 hypothetical protein BDE27_1208 [Xenorhabdus ehlersii]
MLDLTVVFFLKIVILRIMINVFFTVLQLMSVLRLRSTLFQTK